MGIGTFTVKVICKNVQVQKLVKLIFRTPVRTTILKITDV